MILATLFSVAAALVLPLHLISMNVASAGPVVCVWLAWSKGRGSDAHGKVGGRLAWLSLGALLAGVLLGFVLLTIVRADEDSVYWATLGRFAAPTYWYAAAELLFSTICLGIYAVTWNTGCRRPWLHGTLAILSTTNLLYHFPPLMTAIGELSVRPELVSANPIGRPEVVELMRRPEVLAMTAHFALSCFAVTGIALMQLANTCSRRRVAPMACDEAFGFDSLISAGGRIALVPTLLQLLVGMWLLMQMSPVARNALMGGDWMSSLLFGGSLAGALALLHVLAAVALGETGKTYRRRATWLMLIVVLLMAGVLVRSRRPVVATAPDAPAKSFTA